LVYLGFLWCSLALLGIPQHFSVVPRHSSEFLGILWSSLAFLDVFTVEWPEVPGFRNYQEENPKGQTSIK